MVNRSQSVGFIVYILLTRCTHFSANSYILTILGWIWSKGSNQCTVCLLYHLVHCQWKADDSNYCVSTLPSGSLSVKGWRLKWNKSSIKLQGDIYRPFTSDNIERKNHYRKTDKICVTRLTQRVSIVELPTLPEHPGSPPVFSEVRVTRSLVLCVCF